MNAEVLVEFFMIIKEPDEKHDVEFLDEFWKSCGDAFIKPIFLLLKKEKICHLLMKINTGRK